jgi:hypothetical protein
MGYNLGDLWRRLVLPKIAGLGFTSCYLPFNEAVPVPTQPFSTLMRRSSFERIGGC